MTDCSMSSVETCVRGSTGGIIGEGSEPIHSRIYERRDFSIILTDAVAHTVMASNFAKFLYFVRIIRQKCLAFEKSRNSNDSGQTAGIEAAILATRLSFSSAATEGVLLVDASNAFTL